MGGVIVDVPKGALDSAQEITIALASIPAPADYELFSPLYEFRPRGLHFARPITVTLPYSGDPARAFLFWSLPDDSGYELVGTAVDDHHAMGIVDHFSRGFVGHRRSRDGALDVEAMPDSMLADDIPIERSPGDGGAPDGPSEVQTPDAVTDVTMPSSDVAVESSADSEPVDSKTSDDAPGSCNSNSFATSCNPALLAQCATMQRGALIASGGPATLGPSCNPAPINCATYASPGFRLFTFDQPIQMTVGSSRTAGCSNGSVSIRTNCSDPGTDLACVTGVGGPIFTRLLEPGAYYLVVSGNYSGTLELETPPPLPTNTTCASPIELTPNVGYAAPRNTDGTPRYYRFTTIASSQSSLFIGLTSDGGVGTVSVRRDCADPASGSSLTFGYNPDSITMGSQTGDNVYYVVVTGPAGIRYTLRPDFY